MAKKNSAEAELLLFACTNLKLSSSSHADACLTSLTPLRRLKLGIELSSSSFAIANLTSLSHTDVCAKLVSNLAVLREVLDCAYHL